MVIHFYLCWRHSHALVYLTSMNCWCHGVTYGYSVALHLMSLEYSKYNNYDLVNVDEHDASEEALTNYFFG